MLESIKSIENSTPFKQNNIKIHHFIVSAGLKELVEECLPKKLITWTFGCRYKVVYMDEKFKKSPESVPVFCMDETVKTRSIFEIVKGTFEDTKKGVNIKIKDEDLWAPFSNIIYIGDGPTDIPALSLVRSKGGIGIGVYNSNENLSKVKAKLKQMSLDQRTDFITSSNFDLKGELYNYIEAKCNFILKKYEATNIKNLK